MTPESSDSPDQAGSPTATESRPVKNSVDIEISVLKSLMRERDQKGFTLPHDPNFGLVILVRGKPGTGKSTLALQILDMLKHSSKSDKKVYCSMEQSSDDLLFKLISMRTDKAIFDAQMPQYQNPSSGVPLDEFICDYNTFKMSLNRFINTSAIKNDDCFWIKLEARVKKIRTPLYPSAKSVAPHSAANENPPQEQTRSTAINDLTSHIYEFIKSNPGALLPEAIIDFNDGSKAGQNQIGEPFHCIRSRVLLAGAALHELFTTPIPKRDERPFVVIDGLSLLSNSERELMELQNIVEQLRKHSQIGILVYEPNESESVSLDHHADMVIELDRRESNSPNLYLIREISFKKARYQEAALGKHQFKIRGFGITLFPSLHFQVQHYNYMDMELIRTSESYYQPRLLENSKSRQPADVQKGSVLDLIFSPKDGESIVLLGSRGVFKTELSMDFLSRGNWGCENPGAAEKGLLVSLIDNALDIEQGLVCPWRSYCTSFSDLHICPEKCGREEGLLLNARPFCQRPGCITPSEFLHYVLERINNLESLKRIVFWDLTQMDYRFPLFKGDNMLLSAMMDIFKTKRLKSLFVGAGNSDNSPAASAIADNVLFCWRSTFVKGSDSKTKKSEAGGIKPKRSLLLYVDRTSASSRQSGKLLYALPILQGGYGDALKIPKTLNDLQTCKVELEDLEVEESKLSSQIPPKRDGVRIYKYQEDLDYIKRINNMQGVR